MGKTGSSGLPGLDSLDLELHGSVPAGDIAFCTDTSLAEGPATRVEGVLGVLYPNLDIFDEDRYTSLVKRKF